MSKSRIAVLIALLFAAPVAVVALEESSIVGATMEQPQPAEALPIETTATEQPAPQEPVVVAQTTTVVVAPVYTPAPSSVQIMSENDQLNPFNQADMAYAKPLPAQARYFAQVERDRATQLAARSDGSTMAWLPRDADAQGWQPLPAQAAYFERQERQRFASAQPVPTAQPDAVARSEANAQAGSAELTVADTSSIR